ncbi:3-methyl-2-oxobutanoate hydroxymethyltransferase, partial [Staphylococcus capitis]|uniref:3-methyl-2-oxobutanoate hydroxymethyltransferase n=1 Tax=Staphylococcus capitis TaxID=29388 RepID=UPI0016423F46
TPQTLPVIPYKLQRATNQAAVQLIQHPKPIQQPPPLLLVLQPIPTHLPQLITQQLTIPLIPIPPPKHTHPHLFLYHHLFNYAIHPHTKFLKQY